MLTADILVKLERALALIASASGFGKVAIIVDKGRLKRIEITTSETLRDD